jgi:hypothetical protein
MELCPSEDESQLATTEVAVHDLQVVDPDLGFSFRMTSMEMREAVIIEEHDDGDPEEAADRGHVPIMPPTSAVRAQTKHFPLALAPDTFLSMSADRKRSPAANTMDEAIDLAIEGGSPYPDRAAFIDADNPSAGREAMRAASQGLAVVLVAADGKTCVLAPDPSFVP